MSTYVQKALSGMLRVEMAIAFVTLVAMTIALSADLIGRELFRSGVFGAVRFSVFALIYCAMAGFGIATATGSHLRPKFLDGLTGGAFEPLILRLGNLASAAILLILVYGGWKMAAFTREIGETDLTLSIAIWPVQLAVPVGFALSALRHIAYAAFPDLKPEEGSVAE